MDPVVILSSDTVSVGPGEEARVPVRVRNQGRRVESYRIDVVGAPAAFARVDPQTVSVLPGREAEIDVWFNPAAGASTPTGSLAFAVRATSEVDSSSSSVAEGSVELAGAAGLQAWVTNTVRAARWRTGFQMEFANQGNAAVRLAITAHEPSGVLEVGVDHDVIDLQPGGRTTANISAKTRQPFLRGRPISRMIQAHCQSFPFGAERPEPGAVPPIDDPNHRTFQLTMEQKPILSKLVVVLGVVAVGALVAFALLNLPRNEPVELEVVRPDAPPSITAAAQGSNEVFLKWGPVPNATGFVVRQTDAQGAPTGTTFVELEPDQLNFVVTSLEPLANYCYAIVAVGPGGESSPNAAFDCAATLETPELAAPTDLVAESQGGGSFRLTWVYPAEQAEGVEFVYAVDNVKSAEELTDSGATVELEQGAAPRPAIISVFAVRDDEQSNPSNVTVNVEALAPSTTVSPPTTSGGGPVVPPPGGGAGTTTTGPPPGTTTTTTDSEPGSTDDGTTTEPQPGSTDDGTTAEPQPGSTDDATTIAPQAGTTDDGTTIAPQPETTLSTATLGTTPPSSSTSTVPPTTSTSTVPPTSSTSSPTTLSSSTPPTTLAAATADGSLQDVSGTWAAMYEALPVLPPAQGGIALDVQTQKLRDVIGESANIQLFSTRDTIAIDAENLVFQGDPNVTWLYVPHDQATAMTTCAAGGCRAVLLQGAAATSVANGSPIRVIDRFDRNESLTTIDNRLKEIRAFPPAGAATVHVLDGDRYEGFNSSQVMIYVHGLAEEDVLNYCELPEVGGCEAPVPLQPAG